MYHGARNHFGCGRARCWRQAPVGNQHDSGLAADVVRDCGWSDARHPHRLLLQPRRLRRVPAGARQSVWSRGRELLPRLDGVLLGLVDFMVALRRHVHRACFARPHGSRVHGFGSARTVAGMRSVDVGVWRNGDPASRQRWLPGRCRSQIATPDFLHAGSPAAQADYLVHRDHSGGGLLCHLV